MLDLASVDAMPVLGFLVAGSSVLHILGEGRRMNI